MNDFESNQRSIVRRRLAEMLERGDASAIDTTATPVDPSPVDEVAAAKRALLAYAHDPHEHEPVAVRAAEKGFDFARRNKWLLGGLAASAGAVLLLHPKTRSGATTLAKTAARGVLSGVVVSKVRELS